MAGWQRVKVVKDGGWNGVQDITCVFVEVAGSYEKNYSVLGWCQNVLVRLTGDWNYLHYLFI